MPDEPSLKNVPLDVRNYIKYLKLENAKLQRQVLKLQVAKLSIANKNKEMTKLLAKKDKEIEGLWKSQITIINPKE